MDTTTWGNPDGTPLPMLGPTPAEKQARKEKLLAVMVGENPPAAAVQLATNRWPNYDTDPDHGRALTVFVQGYKAALPAASGVSSPGGEGNGWVPVGERLPDDKQKVLVFSKAGNASVAAFNLSTTSEGYNWITPIYIIRRAEVTHWQPLPTPPAHAS